MNKKQITNQELLEAILLLQQEMHYSFREMYVFRDEMYAFRSEMYAFRSEMYAFRSEMYEFRSEMYEFRDNMNAFRAKTEATLGLHSGVLNRLERRADNHSERLRTVEDQIAL